MFFSCPSPLSTSSDILYILDKEALINSDNSKEPIKSQTKHFNSKKFCILQNTFRNALVFKNFSQRNFSYCLGFLILTKNLNTAHTLTEMKQNLLY